FVFFFFFSSRRRHTRWPRDWSSDVCSSDLLSSDWHREAGVLTDAVRQRRRDAIFRLFLTPRTDGLGPRFQLTFATATAERDTAVTKHSLSQGIVEIGNTWRRAHPPPPGGPRPPAPPSGRADG